VALDKRGNNIVTLVFTVFDNFFDPSLNKLAGNALENVDLSQDTSDFMSQFELIGVFPKNHDQRRY